MQFIYFGINQAIDAHDTALAVSGGIPGVRDLGIGENVLESIQNDLYYPTFEEKLTALVFGFNLGHVFADGNKRTCIAVGAYFLEVNGLDVFVTKFMIEMENICVLVADNLIDKDFLQEIITSIINEEEFNEEIKLKIVAALEAYNIKNPDQVLKSKHLDIDSSEEETRL
jgi:death on curing protein